MTTLALVLNICLAWSSPVDCSHQAPLRLSPMAAGICRLEAVRLHREWLEHVQATGQVPTVLIGGERYEFIGASCEGGGE